MIKLKKLLLITLLGTATLFAGFDNIQCNNTAHIATLGIPQTECEALEAVWDAMGQGEGWKNKDNWDTPNTHASTWFGITLTSDNTSIDEIVLDDNNMRGHLPAAVAKLGKLRRMIFGSNHLSGTIPPEIMDMPLLEVLQIAYNNLTGHIPEVINLPKLKRMYLLSNRLTGTIPQSYDKLTNIEWILLDENNLSGTLPNLSGLNKLTFFKIDKNLYTFSDLEPQIGWLGKTPAGEPVPIGYYGPAQKKVDTYGRTVYFEDRLEIVPEVSKNGNDVYRWKKDGTYIDSADGKRVYVKENASSADNGTYIYKITNPNVTLYPGQYADKLNLTLYSNAIYAEYNNKPTLSNPTPKTTVNEGIEYTYTSNISDSDGDGLSVTVGTLPDWLTLTSDATSFRLNGTPDFEEAGSYDINITVTDGKIPVHINYTLTVQQNIPEGYTIGDNTYTHTVTGTSIAIGSPYYYSFPNVDENDDIELYSRNTQWINVYERLTPEGVLTTGYYMTKGSKVKTPTLSTPYPKGSKAILLEEEPKTQKHQPMIMVEIPLTEPVTIGE